MIKEDGHTLKAGCFLIDKQNAKICLIYRDKNDDYTFPKGHLEEGETLKECAVRETAEETKRIAILTEDEPVRDDYVNKSGERCRVYMYFALDGGKSDNDSTDTHEVRWTAIDDALDILTFDNLRSLWWQALPTCKKMAGSE